jgi:hypothetical protein
MITDNSNYVLTILKLDNTDNLYKLKYDYGMLSGGLWNVSLEIGEYALLVMPVDNNESLGSTYTLQANWSSPIGQNQLLSPDLTNVYYYIK